MRKYEISTLLNLIPPHIQPPLFWLSQQTIHGRIRSGAVRRHERNTREQEFTVFR